MMRNEKVALKDRIIKAAAKEIAEKGFFRASTRKISKEAKTSDSAMYYVFGSKEEILAAIVQKGWSDILIRLRKNLLGVSDPVEMMKIVFTTVAGYLMSEQPEIGITMLIDGRKEWGIEEKLVTAEQLEFFEIMEKIIEQGRKMGAFSKGFNIEAARQALFGAGEGLVLGLYLKAKTDYKANYDFKEAAEMCVLMQGAFFSVKKSIDECMKDKDKKKELVKRIAENEELFRLIEIERGTK